MNSNFQNQAMLFAVFIGAAGASIAAVSADEAKQLGGSVLTAWGAEKAGNKEGTIPAYTGERPKPPASFDPKEPGRTPDPYNEKPLFSITAQNMGQYADKLTDGQKALFKHYPNYRMDVYPTHRTAAYPAYVLGNTFKNATSCKAVNNGLRLEGCYGGFPFPIPKTGNEAVWNHLFSSPGHAFSGRVRTYIVDTSGKMILMGDVLSSQEAPYLDPNNKGVLASNSYYAKLRVDYLGPARKVGEKFIILDGLDPLNPGRRAWQYLPGQRRVKLAPDLSYDTPSPVSGGASTMDEQRIFYGAQDRFDMQLLGKKEVFIMYNNFKWNDYKVCPDEVSHTKNFANPDCVRWELHRAWVVQATLKPGFRNTMPKRMMYFDEDSWSGGMGETWDAAGKVYHIDNQIIVPYYYQPHGQQSEGTLTYDLQTGLFASVAGFSFSGPNSGYIPTNPNEDKNFYSPESLAGEGIR